MATVKASLALDMSNTSVWNGDIIQATSSSIVISDGYQKCKYTGNFYYSYGDLSGGTLTGYQEWYGSSTYYTVTGLKVSAALAANYVDSGDTSGLLSIALAGSDSFTGSKYDDVLYGFAGNDAINGGAGDDILDGGTGSDKLTGGKGADYFLINYDDFNFTYPSKITGDTITDFKIADGDQIDLSSSFGNVAIVANKTEGINNGDTLFYDSSSGKVYYDDSGSGEYAVILTLTGKPKISDTDGVFV